MLHKTAENPTVMWIFIQNDFESAENEREEIKEKKLEKVEFENLQMGEHELNSCPDSQLGIER